MKTCKCHSSDIYAQLVTCPKCGHNSFDRLAMACERRRCGYVEDEATDEDV